MLIKVQNSIIIRTNELAETHTCICHKIEQGEIRAKIKGILTISKEISYLVC